MKNHTGKVLAIIYILVALPLYGIYTQAYTFYGSHDYWNNWKILIYILSIAFIVLPAHALYAVLCEKKSAFISLILFPVVATIFGVIVIPFFRYFVGEMMINSIALIVVNMLIMIIAIHAWRSHAK